LLPSFYSTDKLKGFYWPGRIIYGEGCISSLSSILKPIHQVLIVADASISLECFNFISNKIIYRVSSEPNQFLSNDLIKNTNSFEFDFVIAVGGGSTIDLAKMIADFKRYRSKFIHDRDYSDLPPHLISVPTLNGSGSETSRFFVISDESNIKSSYRSWSNVPQLTLIDSNMILSAGKAKIIMGAFDSFIHLWETLICRYESNIFTNINAHRHIPNIISVVHKIVSSDTIDNHDVELLALASAAGGISISNVRTGLIHTLGEALSAQVHLSHPLTLLFFFHSIMKSYQKEVENIWFQMKYNLDNNANFIVDWTYQDFIDFWISSLFKLGCYDEINKCNFSDLNVNSIIDVFKRDTVLLKENPSYIDVNIVRFILEESFDRL